MWLINTGTLELKHAVDSTEHRYVILSHTWTNEEVTFQELSQPVSRRKFGFSKIEKTCSLARAKFKWAWIDTCCIDKTSSAELSEAINSMFTWYRDSQVCYVYLSDLEPTPSDMHEQDRRFFLDRDLGQCRWFRRGWTLQELIAPSDVEFYDREWNFVARKSDIEDLLAHITKIDKSVLRDSSRLRDVPVARRMSWASTRKTTRIEDMAYCLLGIFDANMPLLYGEGGKAFLRLQEVIASEINDLSLFAWQRDTDDEEQQPLQNDRTLSSRLSGIFASSPVDFRHCTTIKQHKDQPYPIHEFSVTGNSIRMKPLLMQEVVSPDFFCHYLLDLNCMKGSECTNGKPQWLAIYITQIGGHFMRVLSDEVALYNSRIDWLKFKETESIFIRKNLLPGEHARIEAFLGSQVRIVKESLPPQIKVSDVSRTPFSLLGVNGNPDCFIFHNPGNEPLIGILRLFLEIGDDPHYWDQTVKCAIVCGLEWKWDHCEPWAAIYIKHNEIDGSSATEIITHCFGSDDSDDHHLSHLDSIRDIMLREHSDELGNMVRETMPQAVILHERRTHRRWKLSLTYGTAAQGRRTIGPDVAVKQHVVRLGCHEVTEQECP